MIGINSEQIAMNRSAIGTSKKNLLKNTAVSCNLSGIELTVNEDGTVLVDGSNNKNTLSALMIGTVTLKAGQKYTLTGCPADLNPGFRLSFLLGTTETSPELSISSDNGNGATFSVATDTVATCRLRIPANGQITNALFKPMLRYAEISDDTYEPYRQSIQNQVESLEANKLSIHNGTPISDNDNLDDYTKPGFYMCPSNVTAKTLSNTPYTKSGFGLYVYCTATDKWIRQRLIPNQLGECSDIFERTSASNNEWSPWFKYTGVQVDNSQ